MKELKIIDVVPSRFETTGKRLIAGMSDRYTFRNQRRHSGAVASVHPIHRYPTR